jgi:hypothetical protein
VNAALKVSTFLALVPTSLGRAGTVAGFAGVGVCASAVDAIKQQTNTVAIFLIYDPPWRATPAGKHLFQG